MNFDNIEISLHKIQVSFTPLFISTLANLSSTINPLLGGVSLLGSIVYTVLKIKHEFFNKNNINNKK
jgi:hypothetical protein